LVLASLVLGILFMKGPYLRLRHDLRRVWECPACKRREITAGTVTFRHCACKAKQSEAKPVVMKLVEDTPTFQPRAGKLVMEASPAAMNAGAGPAGAAEQESKSDRRWDKSFENSQVEPGQLADKALQEFEAGETSVVDVESDLPRE
jgi:hypothetical protein